MADRELPVEIEDMINLNVNTSRTALYAIVHAAYIMGRIAGMSRAQEIVTEHEVKKAGL